MSAAAPPDWWEDFFEGLMTDFWRAAAPADAAGPEAEFIERHLRLAPGARVLDVEVPVPHSHTRFEDGRLTDDEIRLSVLEAVESLAAEARVRERLVLGIAKAFRVHADRRIRANNIRRVDDRHARRHQALRRNRVERGVLEHDEHAARDLDGERLRRLDRRRCHRH